MRKIRGFFIAIIALVFILGLQGVLLMFAIVPNLANRENLQSNLLTRDAYESFIQTVKQDKLTGLLEPTKNISNADYQQFKNDRTSLFSSINKVVTYKKYGQIVKQTTNGIYDWLEGKTNKPEFKITLAKNRQKTVKLLSPVFIKRFNRLPKCSSDFQISSDFSPLSTKCRPQGVSEADVKQYIQESAVDPDFDDLFAEITIEGEDLGVTPEQSTIAQRTYHWLIIAPLAFGILASVSGIWLALLNKSLLGAAKALGISSVIAAIPILLSALIFKFLPKAGYWVMNGLLDLKITSASLIEIITRRVVSDMIYYSLATLIIGIVLLIVSAFMKRKRKGTNIYQSEYLNSKVN